MDAFVVAELLVRIRAGDEDDVRAGAVIGGLGGANARKEDLGVDDLFALQVASALVLHLVFDVEACNAHTDVLVHGVGDHDGT